jgi:hypothetical protein
MSTAAIQKASAASPINAAVATAQIFPAVAPQGSIGAAAAVAIACMLTCPGSSRLEEKLFTVRASGNAATAGAYTVQPVIYAAVAAPAGGTSLTPGNWSAIATGPAVALATTTAPWMIEAKLMFDSTSGKLQGWFDSCINGTFTGSAAIANPLVGLNGATEPVMVFAAGLVFSVANAGNIGKLADFVLDA